MLSVAFAATVRVPEIVAPAVGVMMEAAGGVMSVNVAGAVRGARGPPATPGVRAGRGVRGGGAQVPARRRGPVLWPVGGRVGGRGAVTVVAAGRVTVQAPVPEQPPPLQPVKVEPTAGAAVSVTAGPPAETAPAGAAPLVPSGGLGGASPSGAHRAGVVGVGLRGERKGSTR